MGYALQFFLINQSIVKIEYFRRMFLHQTAQFFENSFEPCGVCLPGNPVTFPEDFQGFRWFT